jgi:hypothetical protein
LNKGPKVESSIEPVATKSISIKLKKKTSISIERSKRGIINIEFGKKNNMLVIDKVKGNNVLNNFPVRMIYCYCYTRKERKKEC